MEILLVTAGIAGFLGLRSKFASMINEGKPSGERHRGPAPIPGRLPSGSDRSVMMQKGSQVNFPISLHSVLPLDNPDEFVRLNPNAWDMFVDEEFMSNYSRHSRLMTDMDHKGLQPEFQKYPYNTMKTKFSEQGHLDDLTTLGQFHVPQRNPLG